MLQVRCEDHIAFEFTKAKEEFGGGGLKVWDNTMLLVGGTQI